LRTKIRLQRSIRAISPVISVLLMIAIAVAASLVAYAWIMGYMGGTTTKVGKAVLIQSLAKDDSGNLLVYVQNVGQGSVEFDAGSCVYINDVRGAVLDITINPLDEGQTTTIRVDLSGITITDEFIKVKAVTRDGTFSEITSKEPVSSLPTAYTLSITVNPTVGGSVIPDIPPPYNYGDVVVLTESPNPGYTFSGWSGDGTGSGTTRTVTMDGNKAVTANFGDVTGPSISDVQVSPGSGVVGTDFTVSADVSDVSGIKSVEAQIQNPDETNVAVIALTGSGTYTGIWDSTTAGSYVVDIVATDNLDNVAEANNAGSFSVGVPDTTGPSISNVQVNPASGIVGDTFTISADVSDPSGVGSVSAQIQLPDETNVATVALTGSGTYTGDWVSTGAGSYLVDIVATDSLANPSEAENAGSFSVSVPDTTAPTVTNVDVSPASGQVGDSFTISADVSDPSGVKTVVAYVEKPDETHFATVPLSDSGGGHYTGTYVSTEVGSYVVDIEATDNLDNVMEYNNNEPFTVTSASNPNVLLNDGFEGSPWNGKWLTTDWQASSSNPHSGTYCAEATDNHEGNFRSVSLDASGATALYVDFWYMQSGYPSTFTLQFYDGSHWDDIETGLKSATENTWTHYTAVITDSQYFISNFAIGFSASMYGSDKARVDDVLVMKITSALLDDGFEGSPWNGNWNDITSNWQVSSTHYAGSHSASASHSNGGYFTSDSVDTSGSVAVYVEFRLYHTSIGGSDLTLQYYNGASWSTATSIGNYGSDYSWQLYTVLITDSQYFTSDFMIRFNAGLDSGDNVYIDNVLILAVPTP
jgi:uncharacterized repeat protein (TIGR02543 family)